MKTKSLYCLALAAAAIGAHAQSSVTLFGVADVGVRHADTDRVGHVTSMVSGALSSARWGIRGAEDLGGGLSASFWLESFLSMDSGAITPAGFQRRSTLSLVHLNFGELRLGRDYTPTHSNWARFDPFNYVGVGSVQLFALGGAGNTPVTAAFGAAPNTVQRASNSLQYLLPRNTLGLEGGLVVSADEDGTAPNDQHRAHGGRLGGRIGPVYLSGAVLRTKNNLTTLGDFKDSALAAEWDANAVKVSIGTRRFAYGAARQHNYLVGVRVPLGAHEVKASWNRADASGRVGATSIANDRADQYAVGYVYSLSKRTRLYGTYARISNQGGARYVVPGAPAGTAGAKSRGMELGINHEF